MSHEVLHHAVTSILQAVSTPHPLGSGPTDSAAHPNLGGCVDSPEAATDILMAFGAAGLFYGSSLARRFSRRNRASAYGRKLGARF
jgi:XrtJ-associated TM-motif-TM protein